MADVFLSYRNTPERRAIVKRLALLLRAHEVTVWWDYGLEAGESYRAQITEELHSARIVVPLWCAQSILSKWVLMEAELGKDKLVPARLQKVVPPDEFEAIQAADLTGWDGAVDHTRALAFVQKICQRLGKENNAPIDMMEELSDLRLLVPLPEIIMHPGQSALLGEDSVLADLRKTWGNFPARDDSSAIEKFLARVRGTAPGSGLEFEVEHALDALRAEAQRREKARQAAEDAERLEAEETAARATEVARRRTPGAEFRDGEGLPLLVTLPQGRFRMGSPDTETGRSIDEAPVHDVQIRYDLAVGKYPVTTGEFRRFIDATGYDMGLDRGDFVIQHDWRDPGFNQDGHHPVVHVNWNDAQAYLDWVKKTTGLPYRLLSEAEWEYACRASSTTPYSFGSFIDPAAANFSASKSGTTPVGSYPANAFGLHDLHGNVWEWTEDCWNADYVGAPSDGSTWASGNCSLRVVRGGSWGNEPIGLRSADRLWSGLAFRFNFLGFRVARRV